MSYKDKIFDFYKVGSKRRNDAGLFTTEVDFTIKIDNPDFDYWKYRDNLYRASFDKLEHCKYNDNIKYEKSPFEFFVRDRLKRITKSERTFLVVTDYSEREGSFIITFSFFVFTTFMNYGQFRESLDYLRDDFNFFLRGVFSKETTILIDYNDRPNHLLDDINEGIFGQIFETVNREFRKLKMIVMLIGSFALSFSLYAAYKIETQPSQPTTDNATIQSIVRIEIDKINAEKTNEELLRLLKEKLEQSKTNKGNDKK
jgi:hypothetical protein